ncbi:MAG: hypothetical protein KatS3mg076_2060 [Candidatus Binatia bacterium]|nr:MAG: hypothetical protein KatS3mg076_2060 [Candidatus Binatia bacterium]
MNTPWLRSESRVVRPIEVAGVLSDVRLRLCRGGSFEKPGRLEVRPEDFPKLDPELHLALNVEALSSAALSPLLERLGLVVRLSCRSLRRNYQGLRGDLGNLPERWRVPPTILRALPWKAGVEITVALVAKGWPAGPTLYSVRPGQWLERVDFVIGRTPRPLFQAERWQREDFERAGLPGDTVYWLQFVSDDLNDVFEEPQDAFRLFIRDDIFDRLKAAENTSSGKAFLAFFYSDIVAEILYRGLRNFDGGELVEGGLLGKLVRRIERSTGRDLAFLSALAQQEDRPALAAVVQAALGVRRWITKLGVS